MFVEPFFVAVISKISKSCSRWGKVKTKRRIGPWWEIQPAGSTDFERVCEECLTKNLLHLLPLILHTPSYDWGRLWSSIWETKYLSELFLLLFVCWNPSSDRIFKAPDVVGGPIINSSELGWAAIGQSASWGKHCQGGVPLVQGRLSTTPLPNTPSRLPTNTPHPPNGMWFACLIVERGCPWPGGLGTRLNVFAEFA